MTQTFYCPCLYGERILTTCPKVVKHFLQLNCSYAYF